MPVTDARYVVKQLYRRAGALANLSADSGSDCMLWEADPNFPIGSGIQIRGKVDVLFVVEQLRIIKATQDLSTDETTWQDYLQMLKGALGDEPEDMSWAHGISKGIGETLAALGYGYWDTNRENQNG